MSEDGDRYEPTLVTALSSQSQLERTSDAQLVVLTGAGVGRSIAVGDGVTLGRHVHGLELSDPVVSRRHAAVYPSELGGYAVRDLESRNGTFVNGVRVEAARLQLGDRVALGGHTVLQIVARDRFAEQRLQAEKLEALGQLARGVAHDFNNLLGVIVANVSHLLALPSLELDHVHAVTAEIEEATVRAAELTRELSAFARSNPRKHVSFTLAEVVEESQRVLVSRASPQVEVRSQLAGAAELCVRGDDGRLVQALVNIGVNAIAAMPGGGCITIQAGPCNRIPEEVRAERLMIPSGELALVTIRDDGVGMNAETQRRAFDPFFTTKARGSGLGLGLPTALAIVRDHGGHVALHSREGAGTAVHVFLPVRAAVGKPRAPSSQALSAAQGTILLADDDVLVRNATQRILETAGFRVLTADHGADALALFEDHRAEIVVVILDLDMPVLDGEQTLTRLRALDPATKVLISSGYVDRERDERLRAAKIDGFVDKPFRAQELLRAVAMVMAADKT